MKELIDSLTKTLGISGAQAEGGAAVLLKAAKDKLGAAEFDSQLGSVPGLYDLLKKAPASGGGGLGGLLGGLAGRRLRQARTQTRRRKEIRARHSWLSAHQGRPGCRLQSRKDPARLNLRNLPCLLSMPSRNSTVTS
jgi:hypothetical protein